jgi:DNA-binding transcriptional ArsR family regulator
MKTTNAHALPAVECIDDAGRAATLLHPLRREIVRRATEPASAAELADRMGLPRQRVNYHVRELAKAGLLRKAGTRRKRNLIERLYVASADSYVLGTEVLGGEAASRASGGGSGASHLIAVAARSQAEVARASADAAARGQEVPAFTLGAEFRFENPAQRARFVDALSDAVARVVESYASPATAADGSAGAGRAHRLVVLCHAIAEPASE